MDAVKRLKDAMSPDAGRQLSPEVLGTVDHVDASGRAWCLVPGNDELVECASPVTVHHGDVVAVSIVAGILTVTHNYTVPSVNDDGYQHVKDIAEEANELLDGVAEAAASADKTVAEMLDDANTASMLVSGMQDAAETAGTTIAQIVADADEAAGTLAGMQDAATAAHTTLTGIYQDAADANAAAVGALAGLSTLESVVGTVSWIAEHGEWTLTQDTTVDPRKQYWLPSGGSYEAVVVPDFTYAATEDTSFGVDKEYYAYDAVADAYVERNPDYAYAPTEDTSVQLEKDYFILVEALCYECARTQDTSVQPDKDYFTRTGAGTDDDPYEYEIVEEPVDEDIGSYYERVEVTQRAYEQVEHPVDEEIGSYYEFVPTGNPYALGLFERVPSDPHAMGCYILDTSGSVSNYIASHLALTDDGLAVMSGGGYSLLVASDGITLRDAALDTVAFYGPNMQIGPASGVHIEQRPNRFSFMQAGASLPSDEVLDELEEGEAVEGEVAFISVVEDEETGETTSTFYMNRSVVLDDLRFGDWKWYNRPNGHMTLQYVGTGV